jgi:hypothetical protein
MESAATSTRIISKEPLRINNLDGILVLREASTRGYQFFYVQWFVATNGYAYQVLGYCKAQDRQNAEAELRGMLPRFSLLDTKRMAVPSGLAFTNNFVSPAHYYTVETTNSAWHAYRSLGKYLPDAEFGGSQGDSCFIVVPVWIGEQQMDMAALTAGLLANLNITYPDEDLTRRQQVNPDGADGVQYDYQRTVDGKFFRYRLRILRKGEFGYLVAAWTSRAPEQADAILNDGLARVHVHVPATILLRSLLPNREQDRKSEAYVYDEAGLYYFKSEDYEKALPLFKAAFAYQRQDVDYLNNVLLTLSRLERNKEGLDYVQTQSGELLKKPNILAYQAYFQSKSSLAAEAITNYAAIFAGGYRDENDFKEYIDLLESGHQYTNALEAIQQYLIGGDSAEIRMLTADIYQAMGEHDQAVKFLEDEHDKAPFNSAITRSLVRNLLDADRPTEALAISKELVRDAPNSCASYYLKAQSEINLKWYKEAKTSLETAARLEPSNEDVKSSLAYVSGLLGEGNNSMLKTPIDPVPLPAALTNWPATIAPADYANDYGCYYQRQIKALYYKPRAEYKTTDYFTIDVLDTTGVATFSTYQMMFDPLGEDLYVNEARVTDASGKTLSTIDPASCYVIDEPYRNVPGRNKVLNIPIAGLQPGYKISLAITRRSYGSLEEFPFLSEAISKPYPVLGGGVYLQGNGDGLNIKTTPEIKRETLPEGLFFSLTNPPVDRLEPMQPPAFSFLPAVWISDKNWQWSRLATNYLATISDRLQPDSSVRAQAEQLVSGLQDTNAKIAVLSRFVQTNCVYKAIEFGRHSRTPNKAADTLRNSYGDCKDLAVLLQQLLQFAGIHANLALVSAENPVQTNLPSLDQFDHMIVEIQQGEAEKFIDCTSRGANLGDSVPLGLAEHLALVLNATNSHLTKLPGYLQNDSRCEVRQQLRLLDTGELSVDETIHYRGIHGAFMRGYLMAISPAYRQQLIQQEMGVTDAKVTKFELGSLDDPGQPLEIKYTFILNNRFRQTKNGLVGKLEAGLERYYVRAEAIANRLTPFEFTIPFQLDGDVSFELPKGFRLADNSDPAGNIKSRFATFESRRQLENNRLKLSYHFHRPTGRYSAADYAAYQDTEAQIMAALDAEIVLQKTAD